MASIVVKVLQIEYFKLLLLAIAMGACRKLNATFSVKSYCSDRVFSVTVANAHIESMKMSALKITKMGWV